jgi:hypothetical protein
LQIFDAFENWSVYSAVFSMHAAIAGIFPRGDKVINSAGVASNMLQPFAPLKCSSISVRVTCLGVLGKIQQVLNFRFKQGRFAFACINGFFGHVHAEYRKTATRDCYGQVAGPAAYVKNRAHERVFVEQLG